MSLSLPRDNTVSRWSLVRDWFVLFATWFFRVGDLTILYLSFGLNLVFTVLSASTSFMIDESSRFPPNLNLTGFVGVKIFPWLSTESLILWLPRYLLELRPLWTAWIGDLDFCDIASPSVLRSCEKEPIFSIGILGSKLTGLDTKCRFCSVFLSGNLFFFSTESAIKMLSFFLFKEWMNLFDKTCLSVLVRFAWLWEVA